MTNKDSVGWNVVAEWGGTVDCYSRADLSDLARRIDEALAAMWVKVQEEELSAFIVMRERAEKAEAELAARKGKSYDEQG